MRNTNLILGRLHPSRAALVIALAIQASGCSDPGSQKNVARPGGTVGEFVTYVADYEDGHSERWHALRTDDGREFRLEFDQAPALATGTRLSVWGDAQGNTFHVTDYEPYRDTSKTLLAEDPNSAPTTYEAPASETYALVLVDLGGGVNVTAAQGQTAMFSATPTDKSFASYYNEVSYGKYSASGAVIGPFSFTMTTCDTTGMYQAIEPQITGTYNHLVYYFSKSSLCTFGGLGEEGSVARPAKRTWINGSLSCVVLMQEPGHNLGLMHANTINCGTSASFSTTPSSCTITEYGSTLSTMGSGCRQFNAYERWYMQWLSGCNGVRVPSSGTFNLAPLETSCPGAAQVLQVPFPATLTVNDPQATTTTVNLKDYYVELRVAGGTFDTYGTSRGIGSGVTFTQPTVFIYASDDVRVPTTTTRSGGNSVWTELINMTPSSTSYTGLTTAGQSFVDPAGGPTITLQSISATGAVVNVTYPNGTGSPTCIDGSTFAAPGPTSSSSSGTGATSSTGGASSAGGSAATGGMRATGGAGALGGATGATGGAKATGGSRASAGATAVGGTSARGGSASTGGSPSTSAGVGGTSTRNTGGSNSVATGGSNAVGGQQSTSTSAGQTGGNVGNATTGGVANAVGGAAGVGGGPTSTNAESNLGGNSGAAVTASSTQPTGSPSITAPSSPSEATGCTCRVAGQNHSRWSLGAGVLGLVFVGLRRRRAR